MRKTVRATLPCPHCGQMIRFNQRNPAYSKKQEIENIRKGIQSLQEYLERLENQSPESKEAFNCPWKDCNKPIYMKVTSRKITFSKRIPRTLKIA